MARWENIHPRDLNDWGASGKSIRSHGQRDMLAYLLAGPLDLSRVRWPHIHHKDKAALASQRKVRRI
jgi:hypothetical protein